MRTLLLLILLASPCLAGPMKAGVAKVIITPKSPLWMAGYASRTKPAEGKLHDLHAKALCIEDEHGHAIVLLTTDLIGLPKSIADQVAALVKTQTGLARDRLMLTSSHTHCGPVLRENLEDMYDMPAEQKVAVREYSASLVKQLVDVMMRAYQNRMPAKITHGQGVADFAINRRQANKTGVVIGLNRDGPVDHRVPILSIEDENGKRLAIVFGYACHNTTLDHFQWSGDYAGFAQIELEKQHPGVIAMFWSGCGADANPNPRRLIEHAESHGKTMARAVVDVLKSPMQALTGTIKSQYDTITLDYAKLPTKEQLISDGLSKNFAMKTRAKRLLAEWEKKGSLATNYEHYPIQSWQIGSGEQSLRWIALGGEVVVDYALRIRVENKHAGSIWITAYANDVMAYIPSDRVLHEGGYEADSSMIYYGLPSRWAFGIEDRICKVVKRQLETK